MKVIETDTGKGLFSENVYVYGDIIHRLEGPIYNKPSRTTIEIGEGKHIDDEYGIYMNHSFNPSCKIENRCIVALNNINIGDELTFNYNENESSMSCPFIDVESNKYVSGRLNNM